MAIRFQNIRATYDYLYSHYNEDAKVARWLVTGRTVIAEEEDVLRRVDEIRKTDPLMGQKLIDAWEHSVMVYLRSTDATTPP